MTQRSLRARALTDFRYIARRFMKRCKGLAKRRARCVTIHPPLARILQKMKRAEHERICPPNWRALWADLHKVAGFASWQPDVLRHTFATHHLATFRSYAELQLEMGHRSAELLRTRYVAMEGVCRRGESMLAR